MTIRRWSIAVSACVLLTGALATYKTLEIKAAIAQGEAFPEHSETVNSALTQSVVYQPNREVLATLIAPQRLELRNELPGKITRVNFASGELVEKSQLLLELDIANEKAQLAAAKARFKLAQSSWKRSQKLRKDNSISEEAYDKAQADYLTTQADIANLQATIDKKQLRAPFAGRAGIHNLEVGQYLQNNSVITNLIGVPGYLWLDFHLPQGTQPIAIGQSITINDQQQAEVIAREAEVSANTRQLKYRAKLAVDGNSALQPNSVINIQVPDGDAINAIEVADTAVGHDRFGAYVYKLNPDGDAFRAERIAVTVLSKNNGRVVLTDGITAGEKIASLGTFKLYPGLKVYVAQSNENETTPVASSEE